MQLLPTQKKNTLQVLVNILADEIHRAHQRCLFEAECDPNRVSRAARSWDGL